MNMKELSFFSHYGPGGRNCTCCGPSPKTRKKHDRMVKHRAKDSIKKFIREQVMVRQLEA